MHRDTLHHLTPPCTTLQDTDILEFVTQCHVLCVTQCLTQDTDTLVCVTLYGHTQVCLAPFKSSLKSTHYTPTSIHCNTQQHVDTATHCTIYILQHTAPLYTATHCNMHVLQHPATCIYCNTLQHVNTSSCARFVMSAASAWAFFLHIEKKRADC